MWDPIARPVYACGLVQAAYAAVSSLHSKVRLPAAVTLSLPPNEKDAFVSVVVAGGFALIVVSGAVVSGVGAGSWISHEWLAGEPSTLLAASVARTSKVCGPTARPVYV